MKKDTQRNFGVGLTMFVAIVCLVSTLVLLSDLNKEGIVIAQSDSNASKFKVIRDQYLQSWENFGFQSIFDTYVVGGTNSGYGVYVEHVSNLSGVSNASSLSSVSNASSLSSVSNASSLSSVSNASSLSSVSMHQVYQVFLTCQTYLVRTLSHREKLCICMWNQWDLPTAQGLMQA